MLELGAQDGGQGAPTALAQIAADSLGLELEQLEFRGRQPRPAGRGHYRRFIARRHGPHGIHGAVAGLPSLEAILVERSTAT